MRNNSQINSLFDRVTNSGWEKGWNDFLNTLDSEKYEKMLNLTREKQAAWKFLMGLCGKRVLNIDTTFGTTSISLAQSFDEVYTLHFDERVSKCIKKRVEELGLKNILIYTIDNMFRLPFLTGYFDAAVLHNLEQILHYPTLRDKGNSEVFIQWLLKEFYRVLSSKGVVFLSTQNKYGYDVMIRRLENLGRNSEKQRRYLSIFSLKKIIKKAKFNNGKFYSLYPRLDYTSEIMNFGYTVSNGSITTKERLKSYIFNNRLFKYFSPAIGLIANKNGDYVSFAERLLSEVKQKRILPAELNSKLKLKQYLILTDKVILTIGEKEETYPNLIVKLPLSDNSFNRCKHEAEILNKLKKSNLEICNKIPTFYYEGLIYRQPYFVLSALKGFSIDLPIKRLRQIFANSAEILIRFHRNTSCKTVIDETKFEELFLNSINRILRNSNNNRFKNLNYIKDYLRERLIGEKINLVWEHGDFYHENILVNPRTLDISGIIDWEMSKRTGLPLLDLLYLIGRTRGCFEKKDFNEIFSNNLLPAQFSVFERTYFERYISSIPLKQKTVLPLTIMCWFNHIAYRMGIRFDEEEFYGILEKIIRSIRQDFE